MQKLSKEPEWAPSNITHEEIRNGYFLSMESMATLNKNTSVLLKRYKSHGATDVTGFGILGHAQNLAGAQKLEIDLVIDSLPIIQGMERKVQGFHDFKVTGGYSAETSGGILTMMAPEQAREFIRASIGEFGQTTWIIG
jgi:selenide,water dikinase